jgi:hypothetical protein
MCAPHAMHTYMYTRHARALCTESRGRSAYVGTALCGMQTISHAFVPVCKPGMPAPCEQSQGAATHIRFSHNWQVVGWTPPPQIHTHCVNTQLRTCMYARHARALCTESGGCCTKASQKDSAAAAPISRHCVKRAGVSLCPAASAGHCIYCSRKWLCPAYALRLQAHTAQTRRMEVIEVWVSMSLCPAASTGD